MKSVRWLLALFLILSLFGATASAETKQGSISLTPMLGGYVFEGNQDIKDDTVFGLGLGYALSKHWTAEAVFNYVEAETETTNDDVDISLYHLDFLYHLSKFYRLEPFLAFGLGAIDVDSDVGGRDTDLMVNYGIGLKYFFCDHFALRGDVRHIIALGSDRDDINNNLAYTFGLSFLFGNKAKAAPAPSPMPAPAAPGDSDGDGVSDDKDRCPGTPAGVPVDSNGCPKDSDGDGVYDHLDKCPGTPAGAPVDKDGCPLDTDGDGVFDYKDDCPDTPKEATVNDRGCWTVEGLLFDIDKATIKSVSFPGLDALANVLTKNAAMKLEIEGHTDNTGTKAYNQILSEKRANAVLEYLVGKGIDKGRLTSKGYGFSRPAASNDTPEDRTKNRRVELKPIK